jgi:HK97 gp10 family phage protein
MADLEGFDDFFDELDKISDNVDKVEKILEEGAAEFVRDLKKLPKPKSKINVPGYSHLVDTFAYELGKREKATVLIGWGKYYGRFLEEGTRKMDPQPHLRKTWDSNQNRYYEIMSKKLMKGV